MCVCVVYEALQVHVPNVIKCICIALSVCMHAYMHYSCPQVCFLVYESVRVCVPCLSMCMCVCVYMS